MAQSKADFLSTLSLQDVMVVRQTDAQVIPGMFVLCLSSPRSHSFSCLSTFQGAV